MNDEYDADREPAEPIEEIASGDAPVDTAPTAPLVDAQVDAEAAQWAPPAVGTPRHSALPPLDHRSEPTTPLPVGPLAPSLMPPAPPASPTSADLSLRRPVIGAPGPRAARSGPPGWLWPAVAVLALVLGLGGGFLGALGYDKLADDGPSGPGYVDGGLAGVDLQELPPLEKPGSVAAVAQAVLPSTVQILAEYGGQASGATGSGWVMDKNGHIVTNNHVIESAAKDKGPIVVVDQNRNRYEATVVGRSPVYDLAVLKVEKYDGLVPAKLGYSSRMRVGEPVVAIGSPLGLPGTVTSGIVSYLQRPVTTGSPSDDSSYINAVQTDAAINPGNSGGPLLNMQGEVIGVNSAIATAGGGSVDSEAGNIGVGFAIPVEQVRVTADQILKTGKAQHPVIGAQVKTGGVTSGEGAELAKIIADSPAEKAGLRKGDVITHVDGERVTEGVALIVAIRTHQPGETIEFTLKRGNSERKIEITLDGEDG